VFAEIFATADERIKIPLFDSLNLAGNPCWNRTTERKLGTRNNFLSERVYWNPS
jgi:hypothetical protein